MASFTGTGLCLVSPAPCCERDLESAMVRELLAVKGWQGWQGWQGRMGRLDTNIRHNPLTPYHFLPFFLPFSLFSFPLFIFHIHTFPRLPILLSPYIYFLFSLLFSPPLPFPSDLFFCWFFCFFFCYIFPFLFIFLSSFHWLTCVSFLILYNYLEILLIFLLYRNFLFSLFLPSSLVSTSFSYIIIIIFFLLLLLLLLLILLFFFWSIPIASTPQNSIFLTWISA